MGTKRIETPARLVMCLALVGALMFGVVGRASALFIVYVKYDATGSNNGSSWSNAYTSLQTALSAPVGGQQIWVAAGTYQPGSARTDTFRLKSGVAIYGGFAGTETLLRQRNPALNVTILSGEIGAVGIADNSYHVVTSGGVDFTAILDGFTITAGNANGASPNDSGGGMYNYNGSNATVRNVTFSANSAIYGGGMGNTSSGPQLTSVTFSSNSAGSGGGMGNNTSDPTLTDVTFSGNTASSGGGGMVNEYSDPKLRNATFSGNNALHGDGIYNYNSDPIIYNSIFWGDGSIEIANVISFPKIANSILAGGCPAGSICSGILNANPVLGPLQNNGGFTTTMALGAGSAAIDKGNNATCTAKDQRGVTRPQGPACDMGAYEVKVRSFTSAGAYDGWVRESGKNSGLGGSVNSTYTTFRVGDDASNRQYRGFLSFNTAGLPDGATVVLAKVKVKSNGIITGMNPFTTHGTLWLDLAQPYFGADLALVTSDFQAAATVSPAGKIGSTLVGGWYMGPLNSSGRSNVNTTGTTQFRLRFNLNNNNDNAADYLSLYSGNDATAANRPVLIVYYNP